MTRISPADAVTPCFSSAITLSIAVYPAVPIAIASNDVSASGNRTSQSPDTRAFCASPPQCDSPTPQPFWITRSPTVQSACSLAVTVPAKSMPGTIGHFRTTGDLPVIARPSL